MGIIILIFVITRIKSCAEDAVYKSEKLTWPDGKLAKMLPDPDSKYGLVNHESNERLDVEVYKISKDKFNIYVDGCKENGFTVDYSKSSDSFYADNDSGYSLSVYYWSDEKTMDIALNAPEKTSKSKKKKATQEEPPEPVTETEASAEATPETESTTEVTPEPTAETESTTEVTPEPTTEAEAAPEAESNLVDGMRPEFKEAMDSYEAFFNQYCEFMRTYQESDNVSAMAEDYANYMAQYADTMSKMDAIDENELNDAELAYYLEVTGRIMQNLATIGQ